MTANSAYANVPLTVTRHEDQGYYQVSVEIEGAVVPVARVDVGLVDQWVDAARETAAQAQRDQAAAQAQTTPPGVPTS